MHFKARVTEKEDWSDYLEHRVSKPYTYCYITLYYHIKTVNINKIICMTFFQTAFEHFVSKGVTMKLTCTYLQKYAKDSQDQRYNDNICWDSVCN